MRLRLGAVKMRAKQRDGELGDEPSDPPAEFRAARLGRGDGPAAARATPRVVVDPLASFPAKPREFSLANAHHRLV